MAKKKLPPRGPQLKLAGELAVAFVNTAGARPDNRQRGVGDYAELLVWAQECGLVQTHDAERLGRRAAERPQDAEAVWARAKKLRSYLFKLFLDSSERQLEEKDVGPLNDAVGETYSALRLVPGEGGFVWGWAGDDDALDRMLWPVVRSAAELVLSLEGRPHVRQCAARGCTLFFVDRTPSRRRTWCSKPLCGNRASSLDYYYRRGRAERDEFNRSAGWWNTRRPRARKQ